MASDFAAQVEDWVRNSEALLEGVVKESTQRVFDIMTTTRGNGGDLPIDTGYLRASVRASTDAPIPIDPNAKGEAGQSYSFNSGPVALVINGASLGSTTFITFTAAYSQYANYKYGYLFVEKAVQQWPQIVNQVQAELKGRLNAQ